MSRIYRSVRRYEAVDERGPGAVGASIGVELEATRRLGVDRGNRQRAVVRVRLRQRFRVRVVLGPHAGSSRSSGSAPARSSVPFDPYPNRGFGRGRAYSTTG